MPYNIVQTREYECIRCKYKLMNQKNGREKPVPKDRPACKCSLWDTERGGLYQRILQYQNRHYIDLVITETRGKKDDRTVGA